MRNFFLTLVVLITISQMAFALDVPPIGVPMAKQPITVDGEREPVWDDAIKMELVEAKTGRRVPGAGTVRLLYDSEAIYLYYAFSDSAVYGTVTERDGRIYEEDAAELFLLLPGGSDTGPYVEFEVNPLGALYDAKMPHPVNIDFNAVRKWNSPGFRYAVKTTDRGWEVECRVSAQIFKQSLSPGMTIRLNATRIDRDGGDTHPYRFYSLVPTYGWFHKPQLFPRFFLEYPDIEQTVVPAVMPQLLVVIVADQFREDYWDSMMPYFSPDGFFRKVQQQGKKLTGVYRYIPTVTAAGHATIATASLPREHGIVNNYWLDRDGKRLVSSVTDDDYAALGKEYGGVSPHFLQQPTLGDILKVKSPNSKVWSVSVKDRGAVLPAGKEGKAVWYDSDSGLWTSSNYYFDSMPAWLDDFNNYEKRERGRITWDPSIDYSVIPFATADEREIETEYYGLPVTLPKRLSFLENQISSRTYKAYMIFPDITDELLELALTVRQEAELGEDEQPDILWISISSLDIAGHTYGPFSWEVLDHLVRMDRALGRFVEEVTSEIGNPVFVFSSDHGVSPIPEETSTGGRLLSSDIEKEMERIVSEEYGEGDWIRAYTFPEFYVNDILAAQKNIAVAEIAGLIAEKLELTGISSVVSTPPALQHSAEWNGYFPGRSGDIVVQLQPYWQAYPGGTGHYSTYNYDVLVPFAFYGFPRGFIEKLPNKVFTDQGLRLIGYVAEER